MRTCDGNLNDYSVYIRSINIFLVWIFILNALYIPSDTLFNMKKIALGLLLGINFNILCSNRPICNINIFVYGVGLTIFSIIYSILLTGEIGMNLNYGYVGSILLLLPIMIYYHIDFEKIFIITMKIMAVFIVVMGLLHVIGIMNVYKNPILLWLNYTNNAKVNPNTVTVIGFSIFILASPALLISLSYFIKNKSIIWMIITACALFFSGTRANVLCGIGCIISCFLLKKTGLINKMITVVLLLICFFLVVADGTIVDYFQYWSNQKAASDAIRDYTLVSIFDGWKDDPFSFISGSGFSSVFYDRGRHEFLSTVELSYWNLLRRVGLPLFIVFMVMFLYPFFVLVKNSKFCFMAVGYLFYLIVAYTNPLLYGSTGMTVVLLMYYLCHIQNGKTTMTFDGFNQKTGCLSLKKKDEVLCKNR